MSEHHLTHCCASQLRQTVVPQLAAAAVQLAEKAEVQGMMWLSRQAFAFVLCRRPWQQLCSHAESVWVLVWGRELLRCIFLLPTWDLLRAAMYS